MQVGNIRCNLCVGVSDWRTDGLPLENPIHREFLKTGTVYLLHPRQLYSSQKRSLFECQNMDDCKNKMTNKQTYKKNNKCLQSVEPTVKLFASRLLSVAFDIMFHSLCRILPLQVISVSSQYGIGKLFQSILHLKRWKTVLFPTPI